MSTVTSATMSATVSAVTSAMRHWPIIVPFVSSLIFFVLFDTFNFDQNWYKSLKVPTYTPSSGRLLHCWFVM